MGLISNGSTIFDAGSMASGFGGSMVFIKKLTASSSSSLTFTHGSSDVILDSTYKEYLFLYKDIHPSTDGPNFYIQFNAGGSAATKTTTSFYAYHKEDGSASQLTYQASYDLAQSTNFIPLTSGSTANNNDDNCCSILHLFDPSDTTFVKHFMVRTQNINSTSDPNSNESYVAGYFNTTTALTRIQFKMSSGNIDSGTFKLYGVS